MAKHNEYGKFGEDLAANFLKKSGYKIIARNYKCRAGEIDIIALETKKARKKTEDYLKMSRYLKDEDVLVFAEVKSRESKLYGAPYEAVDNFKRHQYENASYIFMKENGYNDVQFRFDIIEVVEDKVENYFKNAF